MNESNVPGRSKRGDRRVRTRTPGEHEALLAEAEPVDAKIRALARHGRKCVAAIAYELAQVERRRLFEAFDCRSLVEYARRRQLAFSPSQVGQLVKLVERLERLPRMRAAFIAGKCFWTNLREAAREAIRRGVTPEVEAALLEDARTMSHRALCKKIKEARGEPRTTRVVLALPPADLLTQRAAVERMRSITGQELTNAQAVALICLDYMQRAEAPAGAPTQVAASQAGGAAPPPAGPDVGVTGVSMRAASETPTPMRGDPSRPSASSPALAVAEAVADPINARAGERDRVDGASRSGLETPLAGRASAHPAERAHEQLVPCRRCELLDRARGGTVLGLEVVPAGLLLRIARAERAGSERVAEASPNAPGGVASPYARGAAVWRPAGRNGGTHGGSGSSAALVASRGAPATPSLGRLRSTSDPAAA